MSYRLTIRNGPKVERSSFGSLAEALGALEVRIVELSPAARRRPVDLRYRTIEPAAQVAIRGEVAGPGRWLRPGPRGGVDIRGDGSAEAYLGRSRRSVVEPSEGESPYAALRRALDPG